MKLKKVRALLTALAFTVGTALCVSTVTWAKSVVVKHFCNTYG